MRGGIISMCKYGSEPHRAALARLLQGRWGSPRTLRRRSRAKDADTCWSADSLWLACSSLGREMAVVVAAVGFCFRGWGYILLGPFLFFLFPLVVFFPVCFYLFCCFSCFHSFNFFCVFPVFFSLFSVVFLVFTLSFSLSLPSSFTSPFFPLPFPYPHSIPPSLPPHLPI